MQFTALQKVTLDRTPIRNEPNGDPLGGYAGLSLRFSNDLTKPHYINADQSTILKHGLSSNWTYFGLENNNKDHLGVAFFDHSKSFNFPSPWYVSNIESIPLRYVGSAPLFNSSVVLKQDQQLRFN